MPVFLNTQDADFEKNFTALLSAKRETSPKKAFKTHEKKKQKKTYTFP